LPKEKKKPRRDIGFAKKKNLAKNKCKFCQETKI
jgi:hypothetical protein